MDNLVFVFLDDSTLDVVDSTHNFNGEYEGIDVEDGIYSFFDSNLKRLEPEFTVPNSKGSYSVVSGTYYLKPTNCEKGSFLHLLEKTTSLNPNPWFKTLEEIKNFAIKIV